jgi:DNA polymerase III delta prime subunit
MEEIKRKVRSIAQSESFSLDEKALTNLIESSGNDIRQIINLLQLWNVHGNSDTFTAVGHKDDSVMINNFEAANRLLN